MIAIITQYRRHLLGMIVLGSIIQALTVCTPYISRLFIDRAYPTRDISLMHALLAATLAVSCASLVVRHSKSLAGRILQVRISADIVDALYRDLLALPVVFFDCSNGADIASRLQSVRSSMVTLVILFNTCATNWLVFLVVPALLYSTSPQLALVIAAVLPITMWLCFRQATISRTLMSRYQKHAAVASAYHAETLSQMRVIKTCQMEAYCDARARTLNEAVESVQRRRYELLGRYNSIGGSLRTASLLICTWLGWQAIITGQISLGEFVAFMAYLQLLYSPVQEVVDALSGAQDAVVSLRLATEIANTPPEDVQWRRMMTPPSVMASSDVSDVSLEFERVSFAYPPLKHVLSNATFRLPNEGVIAIVGPSGSGKTTILQLMSGLIVPDSGTIRLAGNDLRGVPLSRLRGQISVAWQEPALFADSLWQNLTLGRAVCSSEVDRIVALCELEELVETLPNGYETLVGPKGILLSSGQRQRIAIARTLLRRTPIALFDEVTANIDKEQEHRLIKGIVAASGHRLMVFVSHRDYVISLADVVLCCRHGHVTDVSSATREDGIERAARVTMVADDTSAEGGPLTL